MLGSLQICLVCSDASINLKPLHQISSKDIYSNCFEFLFFRKIDGNGPTPCPPTILGILQSPDNVAEVEETLHQSLLQEWLLQVRACEPQIRPVLAFIYAYMNS